MQGGPLPDPDRRVGSRSLVAGFALNLGLFAVLVAVSYPLASGLVVATAIGLYALGGRLRRATRERTLRLSRTEVCLCVQFRR